MSEWKSIWDKMCDQQSALLSEALGKQLDESVFAGSTEPVELSEPSVFNKNSIAFTMTREQMVEMGMVEPTPEEQAELDERLRLYEIERAKETRMRERAAVFLGGVTEPAVRAVLDLHSLVESENPELFDPKCAHCMWDDDTHETWPCDTIRVIADTYGIELP